MARDPFVGRHQELEALQSNLEDALSGQGRLMMLAGEPGIGKTRTAQELAFHAERKGAQVLWGRCYEEAGAPPYWLWVQPLRSYIQQQASHRLRQQMGPGAADIASIIPEVREKLAGLEPPPAGPLAGRLLQGTHRAEGHSGPGADAKAGVVFWPLPLADPEAGRAEEESTLETGDVPVSGSKRQMLESPATQLFLDKTRRGLAWLRRTHNAWPEPEPPAPRNLTLRRSLGSSHYSIFPQYSQSAPLAHQGSHLPGGSSRPRRHKNKGKSPPLGVMTPSAGVSPQNT